MKVKNRVFTPRLLADAFSDKNLHIDTDSALLPMKLVSFPSVPKIGRLEPAIQYINKGRTRSFDQVRPMWLGSWDSNPGPIGYTYPSVSKRCGLYLCRDPPKRILGTLVSSLYGAPRPCAGVPTVLACWLITKLAFTVIPKSSS